MPHAPLQHLGSAWFSLVMGLCGLALAWHRAVPLMGTSADHVALGLGVLAAAVFALLAVASAWRARRHPQAWAEDLKHPVRHPFVAAITVSMMLLATVAVVLAGASPWARTLWWVGSLAQLAATVWVLARWWRGNQAGGLVWAGVTPVLLIPVVGNVLAPLAGVPLGHADWSIAQMGIGLLFWPVLLVMVLVRVAVAGMWPERLRPAVFIFTAPPAVLGLAVLQLGAPQALGWAFWGMALFSLLWAATQLPAIRRQAFAVAHWALSFPLAAFTALTLRLAEPGSALVVPAMALLAASSLLVAALMLATVRGLRAGTLLAPETVAVIQPAGA